MEYTWSPVTAVIANNFLRIRKEVRYNEILINCEENTRIEYMYQYVCISIRVYKYLSIQKINFQLFFFALNFIYKYKIFLEPQNIKSKSEDYI